MPYLKVVFGKKTQWCGKKMDSVGMYRKKMLATGNNMQRHWSVGLGVREKTMKPVWLD